MTDYQALMQILSVPRPNGSVAERQTADALQCWLSGRAISHHIHTFQHYPYFFECIGIWLIVSRTLLVVAIWLRLGWVALMLALVGTLGGVLDVAFNMPLVSWPGARRGQNIIVEFGPAEPRQEVVLTAHYDTKTELLDHHARMFFLRKLGIGIVLTFILGALCLLDHWLLAQGMVWSNATYWIGLLLCIPMLFLSWGLGLNLSVGRLLRPSQGAVDNGAACAILIGLAERLDTGAIDLRSTQVTLALFTGEEVNMQGSRAYIKDRDWPLPTAVINMEIMGQRGDYVYWEQDGNVFSLLPCSASVNMALIDAVTTVTGQPARPAGPINSDGGSFVRYGIPTAVLGTSDPIMGFGGMHRPTDHLDRVDLARLSEAVDILTLLLKEVDEGRAAICSSLA